MLNLDGRAENESATVREGIQPKRKDLMKMNSVFPSIATAGGKVDAKDYIEPGTGLALFVAFVVALFGTLFGILATYGILLIVLLLSPLFAFYLRKKATAMIHGSGVHVGESQFPEIHRCVADLKNRLGLRQEVDVYVVEDNVVNALAVRYGKKNVVLLTDDLIHGCLASECPQAFAFVIGHELAHIALNHTGVFRSWMSMHMKKLGRLNEYSADAVATALVGDRGIAVHGMLLLTVGYAMLPYVNAESLARQAEEVAQNKYSKKAERSLTHPLLLNRLQRILAAR
jgi:Zn-dependent protease with chaperone function